MATPDNSSTPVNMSPAGGTAPTDQWVMRSLNELRQEMRDQSARVEAGLTDVKSSLADLDTRVTRIETKINRLLWLTGGAVATLTALYFGYDFVTTHWDITITPKP